MLIDRYSLSQEKVKQVTVVHPSGKKFMSLILDIIKIAIKEIMKRKKYSTGVSLNMEKTEEVISTISTIESEIVGNIKTEQKQIKDKTADIQELLNVIYPSDVNSVSFEEFIGNWHALNKSRLENLKIRDEKVQQVIQKTNDLQEKAQKMLNNRKYEIKQPSSNDLKDLADFYQQIDMPIEKELNIVSLVLYLESTIQVIQNYIQNFSYDEVEVTDEEIRVVQKKLTELQVFEPLVKKIVEKEKMLKDKIEQLRTEKNEESIDVNDDPQEEEDKMIKEAQGKESLRNLLSPRYQFDTSRNVMIRFVSKKKIFAWTDSDAISSADNSMMSLNSTRLYRPLSDTSLNKSREMPPPKQIDKLPSRRRKRDPMLLMEQAMTTSKSKTDLNSTKLGAIPKVVASTPFSSTMLSPDLIHQANFSMISNISTIVETPVSSTHFNKAAASLNIPQLQMLPKPDVLSVDNARPVPWNEQLVTPLVSTDEVIGRRIALEAVDVNKTLEVPKLQLNDESLCDRSNGFMSNKSENTICEKENFGSEVTFDTIMVKTQAGEEDLLNISDTLLVDD